MYSTFSLASACQPPVTIQCLSGQPVSSLTNRGFSLKWIPHPATLETSLIGCGFLSQATQNLFHPLSSPAP